MSFFLPRRMHTTILVLAAVAPAALFACGSSSTGTTTSSSSSSSSSGKASTSSSSGSISSSSSTSSGSGSSSSGTLGTACTDTADQTALNVTHACTLAADVGSCTLGNITSSNPAAGIASCLEAKDGLSTACGACFGTYGACGAQNCLSQCTGDGGDTAPVCQTCIQTACGPAFAECSGLTTLTPPTDAGDCSSSSSSSSSSGSTSSSSGSTSSSSGSSSSGSTSSSSGSSSSGGTGGGDAG